MLWAFPTKWPGRIALACVASLLAFVLTPALRAGPSTILVQDGKPAITVLVNGAILPLDQPAPVRQRNNQPAAGKEPSAEEQRAALAEQLKQESLAEQRRAVRELQDYVKQMSGADLKVDAAKPGATGCYVGLAASFPWLKQDLKNLGEEGFILNSDGKNLFLLADQPLGVRHAVHTLLMGQGCRWFFAGKTWEVVPKNATIAASYELAERPSFDLGRDLWYGFGSDARTGKDHSDWAYRNRMGGNTPSIGHTWYGIDPVKDFEEHPEWFALVKGERKHNKVCYSNPIVIQRMVQYGLDQAAKGARSMSMSPADGVGYCECDQCRSWAKGAKVEDIKGSWFATRPDGVQVCIVSETLFNAVNQVAKAVGQKYPNVVLGCYGYSAYSHPPSFKLEPNVFIETSSSYRRTPLSMEDQMDIWGQRAAHVGVRGYWSVYQWDWDGPMMTGGMSPEGIQKDLQMYVAHHATALNAEFCNNWGPRGLSYYVGSQLLWNTKADIKPIIRDFYEKAFGPAAKPMERYYVRWYGASAVALDPASASVAEGATYKKSDVAGSKKTLAAAVADLDEAAKLVAGQKEYEARIDQIRMYAYYLLLRTKVWDAAATKDNKLIEQAVINETEFGGRLTYTNMIHTRPLLGKAFVRIFKDYLPALADNPDAQGEQGKGFRKIGTPPTHDEVETFWAQAKKDLG